MRVAWFPKAADLAGNPYWRLLQRELEAMGVEFETSHNSYWMTYRWLWRNRGHVDVLHFHFIQPHYVAETQRVSFARLAKLMGYLLFARLLGFRLVWTVHELTPTWPVRPRWVERLGRCAVAQLMHDVIVHCDNAGRALARRCARSRRVRILPLPSYAAVHPNDVCRPLARKRLEIDAASFVVSFVGGIRPNKGIEKLIGVFVQFRGPNLVLLIAGHPCPPATYVEEIRALARADCRIRLRAERVPDDAVQLYINAADVLAFPFEHVLTSSSVMLAMSFGRPVIVPRLGCLPEMVGERGGFVYDPQDPDALRRALQQAMKSDLVSMGAAAARRVNAVTWRDLALGTEEVYGRG